MVREDNATLVSIMMLSHKLLTLIEYSKKTYLLGVHVFFNGTRGNESIDLYIFLLTNTKYSEVG